MNECFCFLHSDFESLKVTIFMNYGFRRDVNRTVYGYGRTPYGNYTASDRTVY